MEEKKWCVYKHTSPNGKVYIGITRRNPLDRWRNGDGYRHQRYFYNAIQKYGWDNFNHEILIDNISRSEASKYEQQYIEKFQSYNEEFGYNISKGGIGSIVIYYGIALIYKSEIVSVYSSYEDAASDFGYTNGTSFRRMMDNCSSIKDCRLEIISKEDYFKYKHIRNKEYAVLYKKYYRQQIANEQSEMRKDKHNIKAVVQIDNNTLKEICTYQSIKQAHEKTGINGGDISQCCLHNQGLAGGYQWRYINDKTPIKKFVNPLAKKCVLQFDENDKFISKYSSLTEAQNKTGINRGNIQAVCDTNKPNHKTAGGYIWRYADEEGEYDGKDISFNGLS